MKKEADKMSTYWSKRLKAAGVRAIKNACPVQKTSFSRENHTAAGYEFVAGYQAALCL